MHPQQGRDITPAADAIAEAPAGNNELPLSEWSTDYDGLDHERDGECRARNKPEEIIGRPRQFVKIHLSKIQENEGEHRSGYE
jgi:hypothetical protein